MKTTETEWIKWDGRNGDDLPDGLDGDTCIEIEFRMGAKTDHSRAARDFRWDHSGSFGDIVAYKICNKEPATVDEWIKWDAPSKNEETIMPEGFDENTTVQVTYADGTESTSNRLARNLRWWKKGKPGDIKAYKVVSEVHFNASDRINYYAMKHGLTVGITSDQEPAPTEPVTNKYTREIKPGCYVDVYDVLKAFDVKCPALQHLIKKALAAGNRGHKDLLTDLDDIIDSAIRAKEMAKDDS